jgi:hypothetical protein
MLQIALSRFILQTMDRIARDAELPASHFFDWQARNYADSQTVAIRRQAGLDPR